MLIEKEIVRPGDYFYIHPETEKPARLSITPELIKHFHDSGKQMLAAGLSVPSPLEHQPQAKPLTKTERAAQTLRDNAGWVNDYKIKDITEKGTDSKETTVKDVLFGVVDVTDADVGKKIKSGSIKWTSPWFNSFTDGDGKKWNGVISHLALTSRPRITKQQPFPSIAAALSLTDTKSDAMPAGIVLSKAGLLSPASDGKFRPRYPVAFSIFSGAKFAAEELEEEKKKAEKPPELKGKESPQTNPNPNGEEEPESLVDADGDISIYAVICDLLCAEGYEMPEGTTKENFAEHMYQTLMNKKKAEAKVPETPPTPEKKPPANPIIAEPPPIAMSMSLEDINKIVDPGQKSIMLSLHESRAKIAKLEKKSFDSVKGALARRIERVAHILPKARVDQLLALHGGIKFSLSDEGVVNDETSISLSTALDILDDAIKGLPEMLTSQMGMTELPHPEEYTGQPSKERIEKVTEELAKSAGVRRKAG